MNEAKHTPGPWEWVGQNLESAGPVTVVDISVSCGQFCYGGTARVEATDADRALIAAAPDMFEALRQIATGGESWHDCARIARAAIAKATA